MDKAGKGSRNEKRCENDLIKEGYAVEKVKRVKWNKQDFFSLWDVLAINGKQLRCIQVKSNRGVSKEWRKRAEDFKCPLFCSKEIWIMYDYKGWKKEVL